MKSLKTFASGAAAGLLIGGAAMAAENTNGSVPFAPSALGAVPFQSIPNPGVQPIPMTKRQCASSSIDRLLFRGL